MSFSDEEGYEDCSGAEAEPSGSEMLQLPGAGGGATLKLTFIIGKFCRKSEK